MRNIFNNIVGNEKAKEILKNTIFSKEILHGYLFDGEEGIGKNLIAKEFAKSILCTGNSEDRALRPCDNCKSCIEFESENNPNFKIIDSEGNAIKIDQIRAMQEKTYEKPLNSDYKVYIINDANLMTKEAQNCLLKTLEEPPSYIVIILISSNENKILSTIKSRAIKIKFDLLTNDEIKKALNIIIQNEKDDKLQENIKNINLEKFISQSNGSVKKALKFIENYKEYEQIDEIFDIIEKANLVEILEKAQIIYSSKDEIYDILNYIISIFNLKIQENLEINNINLVNKYARSILVVEDTIKRLNSNANFDMSIDYLLMNIWDIMKRR